MADLFVHWVQVGVAKIGFLAPDVYGVIGADLGVTKLGNADKVDALVDIGDAIRQGSIMRLRVRYKVGNTKKTSTVICDIDKAPSAIASIRTKSFKGGEITSANIMRRRRLG